MTGFCCAAAQMAVAKRVAVANSCFIHVCFKFLFAKDNEIKV
jgi:hypothetical protein